MRSRKQHLLLSYLFIFLATAQNAHAGFSFTYFYQPQGAFQRVGVFVINDGPVGVYGFVDTGTDFLSADIQFKIGSTEQANFDVRVGAGTNGGDVVDLTNRSDFTDKSWVRVGTALDTSIQSATPTANEWLPSGTSPWLNGRNDFRIKFTGLNGAVLANETPTRPSGYQFAELIVQGFPTITMYGRFSSSTASVDVGVGEPLILEPFPEPTCLLTACAMVVGTMRRNRRCV